MGSDDDVDSAVPEPFDDFLGPRRRDEAAQHLDLDRESRHPFTEGLEMLFDENRRRRQDGDLLAVEDGLERRPDGDLGLPEADVAAQQPVHGANGLHVVLDFGNRAGLIVGQFPCERFLEFLLPR